MRVHPMNAFRRRWAPMAALCIGGWTIGTLAAVAVGTSATAQGSCPTETINFGSGAQNVSDLTDGVDEDNEWSMGAGQDIASVLPCDDRTVFGQNDNDEIHAGSGSDDVHGDANNDDIFGGTSTFFGDRIIGDDGADELFDNESNEVDNLIGEAGPDIIDVQDGDGLDIANGGSQIDDCDSDPGDDRFSCET